ncbi:hypothetical protein HCN51_25925 [Nonomuraea sp. FMUSA5-5]|uniref:Uncharacterized protein n=1 Tax=Nonomuraea composti TaxID=2720023 RepID=A0ABX1BAR1_9ACTN|nr:hypothetical protein [Nonomuraea sp. FMUSA5-5]NJP92854.1 hypothetical protein [Nonomuraea sp. FMUSA5-5]
MDDAGERVFFTLPRDREGLEGRRGRLPGHVAERLDGLPQQEFAGRTVVPVVTGGAQAHRPAEELRPRLRALADEVNAAPLRAVA